MDLRRGAWERSLHPKTGRPKSQTPRRSLEEAAGTPSLAVCSVQEPQLEQAG